MRVRAFLSWDVVPEKLYQGLLSSKCVFFFLSFMQTSFPFDITQSFKSLIFHFYLYLSATGQAWSCRDDPVIHHTPCVASFLFKCPDFNYSSSCLFIQIIVLASCSSFALFDSRERDVSDNKGPTLVLNPGHHSNVWLASSPTEPRKTTPAFVPQRSHGYGLSNGLLCLRLKRMLSLSVLSAIPGFFHHFVCQRKVEGG